MVNSWYRKLVTREDKFHLHKTLGTLCVVSFVWRYACGGINRFGQNKLLDALTLTVHTLLSLTAIQFRVPSKRIPNRPLMIWNEYRLHAVVFSLRAVSVGTILSVDAFWLYRYFVVMFFHVLADIISARVGDSDVTTVRVAQPTAWRTCVLRLYSFYQFLALASHLAVPPSAIMQTSLGFNTLIAIQSSAFLMTLHRKGLIEPMTHGIIYSLCLLLSSYHILVTCFHDPVFLLQVAFVFLLRVIGPQQKCWKYVTWFGFALCAQE